MRLRFWWLGFLLGIFTPLFLGIFFHFANFVFADTTSTSITVNATVSAGPAPVCGNGIVESGEVCDDGNTTSGDGCSATCQLESVCGNGAVESGEQCDDGNTSGQDGCSATCLREAILGSSGNGPEISGVVASATQTTAVVTFQVSSPSAPISSCILDYGLTRNYTAEVLGAVRIGNIYESGLLADLSPSTDYFYRITCTDTAPNSGVYFGVFRTGESDTTPPIVTNVIANTTISMSEINWTATDNVAVIQCTFVLNTYNRNNPQLLVPITLPVTLLSNNQYRVNANGLYTHETYSFRITCVDDLPNATVVNGSFTTQTDQTPPPDVARFTAAGQDSRNVLEWVYPTIQDSAFFMIRRSTSGFPLSVLDGTLVTSTIYYNRNFLDEGLENGTTYYYTIFVFDTSGNHSNGVSASATPRPAGDRDGDGVNDDMDACDGNRTGQIDTPSGTVVGANGCPFVAINVRNLTIYPVLLYSRTARDQFNRPMGAVSFSGRSQIGGGLQPGVWFLDSPSYGVEFSVESNGHITWPPSLDAIYSAVYGSSGSVIQVLGIPLTIDTSRLDPRNQLRLYSPNLGTNFLPDRASVRLLPGQNYYFSHPYFATFLLSSSGLVD
jgi:cysteine-rich repeat protein